jgi:hypothetical protein
VRIASGESQDWSLGRRGCEARSFLVLHLYMSNAVLKMDARLEWEVDVEGIVDMMVARENGTSMSSRAARASQTNADSWKGSTRSTRSKGLVSLKQLSQTSFTARSADSLS